MVVRHGDDREQYGELKRRRYGRWVWKETCGVVETATGSNEATPSDHATVLSGSGRSRIVPAKSLPM